MDKWYLYNWEYTDNVEEFYVEQKISQQTATSRHFRDRSFFTVTNKKRDHLDSLYEGSYEMCMYWLDYMLHRNRLDDTFTFTNLDLWDLYEKNWKKHQKAIDDNSKFELINNLDNIEFELESFNVNEKHGFHRKNKYVYFLKKNEEIVYVGQTTAKHIDRTSRPNGHSDKDFDSFDMILIEDSMDLDLVEAYYIIKHKPKYNKNLPVGKEWFNVIRYALRTTWLPPRNANSLI